MIFTLQPGVAATLPAQLLSVRLQVLGSAALPELEAVMLGSDGSERPVTDLVSHPGRLVLAVREPTLVRIRPAAGQASFAAGALFGLVVGPESPDADRAVLKSVDASGLAECGLVTMTPGGPDVVVTAVAQAAQAVLPPGADQARVAARELIGAPRVALAEAVAVRLVVDSSASLRQSFGSGWLARAIELISGIASVVSDLTTLPVTACGRSQVALPDHELAEPATATVDELAELPPSIGFRSALVPDGGGHGLTYVITDAWPPDLTDDRRDLVHLVLLGAAGTAARAGSPGRTGATVIDVSGPPEAVTDQQVAAWVRSLLADYRRIHRPQGPKP